MKILHCQYQNTCTFVHNYSISWPDTNISIKSGRVNLVLWAPTSPLSEMKQSMKYHPHYKQNDVKYITILV